MKSGKKYIGITGPVTSGRSGTSWWTGGRFTGSETVAQQIGTSGDIEIYINSPGGSVFAGFEILNAINAAAAAGRKVDVYVASMAASIASYISTGVKNATVHMAENAKLMFHAPWTVVMGSREQLADAASLLEKMEEDLARAITARGATFDKDWFAAGRMKWLSAKEAIAAKLADDIADPPQELIAAVMASAGNGSDGGFEDRAEDETKAKNERRPFSSMPEYDRFAATVSFSGLLEQMCVERFGQGTTVELVSDGLVNANKPNGESSLLKYSANSLNIVAIEWDTEVVQNANEESKMNGKLNSGQPTADEAKAAADKAQAEADAKAAADKAEADAKAAADLEAKVAAEAAEADAKAKLAAEPKAAGSKLTLPADMTQDMVDFAVENYKSARDSHLAVIRANPDNQFNDEELSKFPVSMLAKMSAIADTQKVKAKADKALIAPAPVAKGTEGTLPPPEL